MSTATPERASHAERLGFYLSGRRGAGLGDAGGLRPALQAGYADLSLLRHDFPLVLLGADAPGAPAQPLSTLVDAALERVATGADAERMRRQVLRIEQEIRSLVAGGAQGTLGALWAQAVQRLAGARDAGFGAAATKARAAIGVDGRVLACDPALPETLLRHAWAQAQQRKAAAFGRRVMRLILGLSDILRADFERSDAGRSAGRLAASLGGGHGEMFDFEAMSGLLTRALPRSAMTPPRRERIRQLLAVLDAQSFVALPDADAARAAGNAAYDYVFDSCAAALAAWRERAPRLVELARATAMAELEIEGQYSAERHDALFESFGANGLEAEELARYPDYLVCLDGGALDADEQARLLEILSGDLPIKLLYRIDDLLDAPPGAQGGDAAAGSGLRARQIAHMAMGLNQVYVMHAAASQLGGAGTRIAAGMAFGGPALFCVFSGAGGGAAGQPSYLTAAAAVESRAFPSFVYDPSAGADWASRLSLAGNPQPELDWPIHPFAYEDARHQRMSRDLAFTFVDFVAADPRFAPHLARLPAGAGEEDLVAVDEALAKPRRGLPERVPRLAMIDAGNTLHQVIADECLLRQARRQLEMWRSLQELGGVHNSHAERLLARERQAWEQRHAAEAVAMPAPVAAGPSADAAPAAAPAEPAQEPARSRDEAYIETARCSTCNECTQINPRMFGYDANKQAHIIDIDAGTYAQLVEAAESCQVAVIHPGKPRNPDEPGLEALLARAEPFR